MLFRGRRYGNDTIDVVNKSCFHQYDTLACLRSIVLTTAAGIAIVFVVCKIYKYHIYKHKQIQHYAIFYITAVEILVCMSSFMIGHKLPQLKFSANFLKLLQFSVICHLHWSSSARAHHKEDIIQHAINPGLCLYMIYCTAVALMGMVDIGMPWNECLKPYWLMLSAADTLAVQCFALAAIYITHKTNGFSSPESFRSAQKRDLLTIVIAYELSSVFSIAFDSLMRFVGTEETGCSGVFGHSQFFYSATELVFNVGKYLLPVWAILVVFQPVEDNGNSEAAISGGCSLDGTPTSARSSIRGFHQYQRMTVPPSVLSPDNLTPSNHTNPVTLETPPSPSNSNSSLPSLSCQDGLGYTNRITLNFNPRMDEKFMNSFHQTGLTTISEESNINTMDSMERSSVQSARSENSYY
ncbi:UNVERIFIED_CONTAM: hypothetical protein PYX00_006004 [Menopon gallinae]|uniref:Uncharacterized protein n=1 Tax=Menopon gallinae TaxID=328185 RepID=A0AAW2HVG4_9NEOP